MRSKKGLDYHILPSLNQDLLQCGCGTQMDQNGPPKWAKMDHFGPFWCCGCWNPVRNKVVLTKQPPFPRHSPKQCSLFPGTLSSTLPGTFGDLGFLSPVASGPDFNSSHRNVKFENSEVFPCD